jgi:hypothetical protein
MKTDYKFLGVDVKITYFEGDYVYLDKELKEPLLGNNFNRKNKKFNKYYFFNFAK